MKISYTEYELIELQKCLNPDTGFLYFLSNYYNIQDPVRGIILYKPYEYQIRLLKEFHNRSRTIALLFRQSGKTVTALGYLLWYAMMNPYKTVVIVTRNKYSAADAMHRIRTAYELCPEYIKCQTTIMNKTLIDFDNGSRIIIEPASENMCRGMTISLLYIDEFAFMQDNVASYICRNMMPTIANVGKIIITSTKNTENDMFARIWKGSNNVMYDSIKNQWQVHITDYNSSTVINPENNGFYAIRVGWDGHPTRDEVWKQEQIYNIGPARFTIEYEPDFISQ
mgnify:FL=1